MFKVKLKNIATETTLLLYSFLVFIILYTQISLDLNKQFMIPAIISASQILFWGIILTAGLFQIYLFNFELRKNLSNLLISLVSIAIANNAFGFTIALSGTPTSTGDIRGDFGNYIKLAERAKEFFWPGNLYPPIYFFVIGRISKITGIDVILLFKPVDIAICFLLPIAIFSAWKLILSKNLSLVVTLITILNFTMTWKNAANLLFLPFTIGLILKTRKIDEIKTNSRKLIISNLFYGITLGLICLTYFGPLYWSFLSMAIVIFSSLFYVRRSIYSKAIIDYLLGFTIVFLPTIARYYFGIGTLEIIGFLTLTLIYYFIRLKLPVINLILIPLISLGLIYTFFLKLETNDTFIYNSIDVLNPTWTLFSSFDFTNIIIIIFVSIIILKSNYDSRSSIILLVIFINIIGALIQKYYLIISAYQTGYVDLFPRADFQIYYYSVLFISLLIMFFISKHKSTTDFFEIKKFENFANKVKIVLFAFIISSTVFYQLSNRMYNYFPNEDIASPYSQSLNSCKNSNEDPALAKIFEENPRWEKVLEKNCPPK
jgi:hypothetical protein